MQAFQKHVVYGLWVVLMISTVSSPATAEEAPFTGAGAVGTVIEPDREMFFFPDALSNFSGFTSSGSDPNNICSEATPKLTFNQNEPVFFNVFWSDTVESDKLNDYEITVAVKAAGNLIILYHDGFIRIDLREFGVGDPVPLCLWVAITVPPNAPPGTFPWGARIIKLADGDTLQGKLNDTTVQ